MPNVDHSTRDRPKRVTAVGDVEANSAQAYAVELIHRVCCLAGSGDYIREIRNDNRELRAAIDRHDTPALFDWLMVAFSHQGVSDRIVGQYMEDHGRISWAEIERTVAAQPICPRLEGYWTFHGCQYHKTSGTCSEPEFIGSCPLPGHQLRNGRLNQTAHSLYFFIRDVAQNDLVGWFDDRLTDLDREPNVYSVSHMRAAVLDPLRNVFGISDKVLCMALSAMFMAAPRSKSAWRRVGPAMIAIDTLVHNFLHRTGILERFGDGHLYGPACYGTAGCANLLQMVADHIDAREFNSRFPKIFPRFIQHAIWRYCSENGLNVCNGNQIDDRGPCENRFCSLFRRCDRKVLGRARQ